MDAVNENVDVPYDDKCTASDIRDLAEMMISDLSRGGSGYGLSVSKSVLPKRAPKKPAGAKKSCNCPLKRLKIRKTGRRRYGCEE